MSENLVIVESPAKAKTIEKFLGKGFKVMSSFGHVRDLASKKLSIDIENNFEPEYEISSDKKKLINDLKKRVKESEIVWLATDEDREGEAISWHLYEVLKLKNKITKRIVFHEITKKAIMEAVKNPRKINDNLVNAQQARRVLDRLVGFKLSPVLWRKVQSGLSAGRVQSVALRLIVEREREIINFKPVQSYKITAVFYTSEGKKEEFKAEIARKIKSYKEAKKILEDASISDFKIVDITKKPSLRKPSAPFITSSLQQQASYKFGFSLSKTMLIAQKLYEAGYITYMRTDSVNLSETALEQAEKIIRNNYGDKYYKKRIYKTKDKSAQEAHEAIRPTDFELKTLNATKDEQKLYELIWKRAIASQMSDAQFEKTNVSISGSNLTDKIKALGEVLIFEGFLSVYMEENEENREIGGMLPKLVNNQDLILKSMEATQKFSKPPARFTEASLVKKLEELGIGRPSTYAPTITTIQKRGYVEKGNKDGKEREIKILTLLEKKIREKTKKEKFANDKGKLIPQDKGILVTDFLVEHFTEILNYNFTAQVEKKFDSIATGKTIWQNMIKDFYTSFEPQVTKTLEVARKPVEARLLGQDPKTKQNIYVKFGKFGTYVQMGETPDAENKSDKPRFASLKKNQSLETIDLQEALELFKLPRELGQYKEIDVIVTSGPFGPYIKYGKTNCAIGKDNNPYSMEMQEAIQIIDKRIEFLKNRDIASFDYQGDEIKILRGRYGPYICYKKKNYKIPKDINAEKLTLEQSISLITETDVKKGSEKRKKKKK